jgi:hypothetical protein
MIQVGALNNAYLECIEASTLPISVKTQVIPYPVTRPRVLLMETHEQHGIYGIHNGVPDATRGRKVGASVTDGMVLVRAHCVAFYDEIKKGVRSGHLVCIKKIEQKDKP